MNLNIQKLIAYKEKDSKQIIATWCNRDNDRSMNILQRHIKEVLTDLKTHNT